MAEPADATAEIVGLDMTGTRVVIQGFGAVGQAAAERFIELGAVVVGNSTAVGARQDVDGLDIPRLVALRRSLNDPCVREYEALVLPADDVLSVDTDILVPAAREDVLGEEIPISMTAGLVVEGANMPTTSEAKRTLHSRGIAVVPDFIAKAGGVVAADIFTMILDRLQANTVHVLENALSGGVTSHEAAQLLAQKTSLRGAARTALPDQNPQVSLA